MFYIVETQEQLDKVIAYENTEVFMDIIPLDDRIHPAMNTPSLIYFRPLTAKRGFILVISHMEGFSLSFREVMTFLIDRIPQIYTIDKKTLLYYGVKEESVISLKMANTLWSDPEFPDISKYGTPAHSHFERKLGKRLDVNRFIPISKHYEKYENYFNDLSFYPYQYVHETFQFYNSEVTKAFFEIERNGLGINQEKFNHHFPRLDQRFNVQDNTIYSSYNLYNITARPSCTFNGFNFVSLKKSDESRKSLVPKNDGFVEFDYKSYQVKLLANFLQFDFGSDDPHHYLNKIYFGEDYTPEQGDEGKKLTFRYLYGRDPESPDIEFFQQVYALRDQLWENHEKDGYIVSPITGRMIYGITEITQILPYLMQCHETERNTIIINKLLNLLSNFNTKLVLYTYDAFLFDFSLDDGRKLIGKIRTILEGDDYKTSMKIGASFGELLKY